MTSDAAQQNSIDIWEAAYMRFETPAEELQKFLKRLRELGCDAWPKETQILELFCGRGNGIRAWHELGFTNVQGLDISQKLIDQYTGPAKLHQGDARDTKLPAASFDVICIQGGLHHLDLMDDFTRSLDEIKRLLKPGGKLVVIEPWDGPFLKFVHAVAHSPARHMWGKLDALATMIKHEEKTYFDWLSKADLLLAEFDKRFTVEKRKIGWGKMMMVGVRG